MPRAGSCAVFLSSEFLDLRKFCFSHCSSSKRHIFLSLRTKVESGSKHLIVESMASVGINADVTDIVYAAAPGDTRSGFVTVRLVAQVTESA